MFYYDGVGVLVDAKGFARRQACPSAPGAASPCRRAPCSPGSAERDGAQHRGRWWQGLPESLPSGRQRSQALVGQESRPALPGAGRGHGLWAEGGAHRVPLPVGTRWVMAPWAPAAPRAGSACKQSPKHRRATGSCAVPAPARGGGPPGTPPRLQQPLWPRCQPSAAAGLPVTPCFYSRTKGFVVFFFLFFFVKNPIWLTDIIIASINPTVNQPASI